ncbi:MAG: STAS/SEC14 domain-containing protein [Myxococcota bacterium]
MIERIEGLPEGIDGIRASGKVTKEDYEKAVTPLLEGARRSGRRVRLLYQMDADLGSFTPGAALEDARIGIKYLRNIERCAVVSDATWLRETLRVIGALLPCPVKTFRGSERDMAIEWLDSPAEGAHKNFSLKEDVGVLILEPKNPLRREDFDAIAMTVDPWLETHKQLNGILIHTKNFSGWDNFGSMIRHFDFVRDHHRKVKRVALVTDSRLAQLIPIFADHFVAAELKKFADGEFAQALDWVSASSPQERKKKDSVKRKEKAPASTGKQASPTV